jgi:hypothetical protein
MTVDDLFAAAKVETVVVNIPKTSRASLRKLLRQPRFPR